MNESRKLNVLYILTKLELGGAQKVCFTLFKNIKKTEGFSGLISGEEGILVDKVKKFDSVYLIKNLKREFRFKNFLNEIRSFFQIIKIIKRLLKIYPDLIIHTHSTKAGIIGRWAAFFAGANKRIHTVHGFGFHKYQNIFSWTIIYLFEFFTSFITTHFVCVSYFDQKIGIKLLPFFYKRSSVIRAAVDYEKFYLPAKNINYLNDEFIIGTVSCFKPQKNLFDLLKAFKKVCNELPEKKLKLQIIGDGNLNKDIKLWIIKNNIKNKVELLGWKDEVYFWMKKWNLFILSSLWEGLPCAIVEARLSKLPVVSYKIAGIPEVIFDKQNGFLIEPKNWKSLSDKIKVIIEHPIIYKKMVFYNDNLEQFNNVKMINNYIKLYRSLI